MRDQLLSERRTESGTYASGGAARNDDLRPYAACQHRAETLPHPQYDLTSGERWYVAMTQPRKERVAEENLKRQQFRCFLPLQKATTRHARKFVTKLAPVFLGYIFVIISVDQQRWRSVNGTIGVARLLTANDKPIPVAPGVVETLVKSSDKRSALVFEPSLAAGDKVRLRSGPFADALGVLQSLDGAGRVALMLDLVNGRVKLSAPRELVTVVAG